MLSSVFKWCICIHYLNTVVWSIYKPPSSDWRQQMVMLSEMDVPSAHCMPMHHSCNPSDARWQTQLGDAASEEGSQRGRWGGAA